MGRMAFGLREESYWPKNGLRSNLIAPKFQCPQAPPRVAIAFMRTLYQPDHSKSDGYGLVQALVCGTCNMKRSLVIKHTVWLVTMVTHWDRVVSCCQGQGMCTIESL